MNIKLTALTAGILACISGAAMAQPPASPDFYKGGPVSPALNATDISASERSAFALFEGVLQVAEAEIHANQTNGSCSTFDYPVKITTNGTGGSIIVGTKSTPQFVLTSVVNAADPQGRGQSVTVTGGTGVLNGITITSYGATYVYNSAEDMMISNTSKTGLIWNGLPITYTGTVIKDFFQGSFDSSNVDFYNIFDWGLQAVSKLGYPVEKWWQRSISHRSDGTNGRTIFVKDRLVGDSSCRIVLETNGQNDRTWFIQGGGSEGPTYGHLTVTQNVPSDPVLAVEPQTPAAAPSPLWDATTGSELQSPFNQL